MVLLVCCEEALFVEMGLTLGKRRRLVVPLADAAGFDCWAETAVAQLQNRRVGRNS